MTEIEAKVKYVKLARSLRTYGVSFFLVKVRWRQAAAAYSSKKTKWRKQKCPQAFFTSKKEADLGKSQHLLSPKHETVSLRFALNWIVKIVLEAAPASLM